MELHREGSAPAVCEAGLFLKILNLEEHHICIIHSRVMAVLCIGGASAEEGLLLTGPTPSSFHVIPKWCKFFSSDLFKKI